jgi:hypothetical protein
VGLGLGLALFVYQVALALGALAANPQPLHGGVLGALLGLDLMSYVLLLLGWGIIVRSLRLQLSPRHLFDGYVLAFLPRYIPGSVWGYVSRGEWMRRVSGARYAQSTAASLLEISIQFGTAGLFVVLGLAPQAWRPLVLAAGIPALAVPWWLLQRFYLRAEEVGAVRLGWAWAALLLNYPPFWTVHGLTVLAALQAVGSSAELSLPAAVFAFCASWLVGFAAIFVPAGLGVRELTLAALLQQMAGIDGPTASLVAVLTRLGIVAAELLFLLVAGGLALLDVRRVRRDVATELDQPDQSDQRLAYAPDHPDTLL